MPLWLFGAGIVAGAMNAFAGGGSFVTVPLLMLAGVPATAANATSTAALCPGSLASAWALRDDFAPPLRARTSWLVATSTIGAAIGAVLLLVTPDRDFRALLPWLMLLGTLAFALGPRVSRTFGDPTPGIEGGRRAAPLPVLAVQLVLGVYAGYFGGAVGIMMMAAWHIIAAAARAGPDDVRAIVAAKAVMVGAANAVATICFAIAGRVWWPPAVLMLVGAVIGGFAGAILARRLPQPRLRTAIVVISAAMTIAMFVYARSIPAR